MAEGSLYYSPDLQKKIIAQFILKLIHSNLMKFYIDTCLYLNY